MTDIAPHALPAPPPGFIMGLDTSRAQGSRLDSDALRAAGVSFVIVKATDGLHDIEPTWEAHGRAALDAGAVLGAYGALEPYPSTEAAAQANHFCDVVQGTSAQLVALDFELGKGRPASDLLRAARIWLDTVEARLGLRALLYTMPMFWNALVNWAGDAGTDDARAIATRPLWLADYGNGTRALDPMIDHPRVPFEWAEPGCAIWQVGPHGATLPGTSTAVDVNWFEGDISALHALAALPSLTVPALSPAETDPQKGQSSP